MLNIPKLNKIFIISLIFISFISCDKYDDGIPNIRFNITLHLDTELATLGHMQARKIQGGVNGIILFRTADLEFNAYERTCPYEPAKNCQVDYIEGDLFATCPCCGSEFDLVYGDLRKGPAKWPLKKYRTSVSNSFLSISN
jgi:nitrite reductase/ring-hydroxylating ferredoxin subunit